MTTQEKCVEVKKEANSLHGENDVSNRHMTWWKNAWWIRVDSGPHLRTARGRRRIWRAARRAAEQARDDDRVEETQSFAEEAEGETWGRRKGERQNKQCNENTLHLVIHLSTTMTRDRKSVVEKTTTSVWCCTGCHPRWRRVFTGTRFSAVGRHSLVSAFGDGSRCHDEASRTQHQHFHEEIELELGLDICVDGGPRLPWRRVRALVLVGFGHGPVLLRRPPTVAVVLSENCDLPEHATGMCATSSPECPSGSDRLELDSIYQTCFDYDVRKRTAT